jgi:hypothetical protein
MEADAGEAKTWLCSASLFTQMQAVGGDTTLEKHKRRRYIILFNNFFFFSFYLNEAVTTEKRNAVTAFLRCKNAATLHRPTFKRKASDCELIEGMFTASSS